MVLRPRRPARSTVAAALVRAAPMVLGAVAAGIWLRRRHLERPALPVRAGIPAPTPARPARPRTGRFERGAGRRPVDIVTVVDDLLGAAR